MATVNLAFQYRSATIRYSHADKFLHFAEVSLSISMERKHNTADRRSFLKQSFLSSLAFALGTHIVFADNMPHGYLPVALDSTDPFSLSDKHPAMIKLNERPWNIESPAHLLDDDVTPAEKMFVRNNGLIP